MKVTQLTPRVAQISEYTAVCTCHVFTVDGIERLQAYKGYLYASDPKYSRIGSEGTRYEISREEFKSELSRIMQLN